MLKNALGSHKTLNHPKADPERRSMFCQKINELKKKDRKLVYIDESGFMHDMPRTHGYSDKGKRCYGTHNWGVKERTNAIGALIDSSLIAIGLISGSINSVVFSSWVEQILLPNLPKESVVVMDNASFHKGKDIQKMLKDSGHTLLYLPPYSPDLNPIEHKWAHPKQIRRSTNCSIDQIFNTYLI